MSDDYERVLCVKNEVFVYRIPPRTTNRGYRAADWSLDKPDWKGRLRGVSKNSELWLKLEDHNSGEEFAKGKIEKYPGVSLEQVLDSSRYFVLRILDPSGRAAFIGIGFADRADSFDLLVTIQDHFKWIDREKDENKEKPQFDPGPKLDLGFKEGQTITIKNLGTKTERSAKPRPRATGGMPGLLPPPPGGSSKLLPPPKSSQSSVSPTHSASSSGNTSPSPPQTTPTSNTSNNLDLLLDFDFGATPAQPALQPSSQPVLLPASQGTAQVDGWGDFTSAEVKASANSLDDWSGF